MCTVHRHITLPDGISEMCSVYRSRTLFRRNIRNVYCAQKQNIFYTEHHKCVQCTETEHSPDGAHKAVFTDHKTTFKNETQLFTVIPIHQHMQLTHNKSHTQATHSRYSLMYTFQFMLCTYVGITNGGGRNASNE